MSHFAPFPLQAVTITDLGDELRSLGPTGAPPSGYAACRSAWIGTSRILTWFQLGKLLLTTLA